MPFVSGFHANEKMRIINGEVVCEDVFDIHLTVGERAEIGIPNLEKVYKAEKGESMAVLDIYASTDKKPRYVTDKSCLKVGSMVINLTVDYEARQKISVTLQYSGTELSVIAREDHTGKTVTATLDFLG